MTAAHPLPEWIDRSAWDGWLAMRKLCRKPATDRALTMALAKLYELRAQGQDANAVLAQSEFHCWTDLYPARQQAQAERPTFRERDADNAARLFNDWTGGIIGTREAAAALRGEVIDMEATRARIKGR